MGRFDALLELQAHDTRIEQLRHRRETLEQREQLKALSAERHALHEKTGESRRLRDELGSRQKMLEGEVAANDRRISDIERRLYSGTISASKDLQAMSEEVESLKRRKSSLEDEVLAVMEKKEPADSELADADVRLAEIDARGLALRDALGDAEAEIDREIADERVARGKIAASIDEQLLRQYENIRSRSGGIGAAKLDGDRCGGCHLSLSAAEVAEIKKQPDDAVVLCPDCSRILVR